MAAGSRLLGPHQMLGVVVLAAVAGGALAARSALGIEWELESLRALVGRLGIWGPVGFALLVAFRTPLLLPSQVVLTLGGLCFGVAGGTLWGGTGLFLSALFAFTLTRWLGADLLRERVPGGLRRTLEAAGSRGGAALLAVASAWPVGPISVFHAAAALTSMHLATFAAAAAAGCLGRASLYAFFGSGLVEGRWEQVALAAGVVAASFLPLLHPAVRRWLRRQLQAS